MGALQSVQELAYALSRCMQNVFRPRSENMAREAVAGDRGRERIRSVTHKRMKEAKFTDDNGQQFKPARVEDVTEVCFKCKRSLDMKSDLDIRHDKDMGEKRLRKKRYGGPPAGVLKQRGRQRR